MTTSSLINSATNGTSTLGSSGNSAASTAASQTASSSSQLASNMNTFLQLLTTQLQYQDPMNPMDTSQFTNQLVEFASVQQEIDINQNLESMMSSQNNAALASAANYLGTNVTAVSSSLPLQSGSSTFYYTTPANSTGVNIVISDSSGNIVDTMNGSAVAGTHAVSWNGDNIYGQTEPDGTYTLSVSSTGSNGTSTQLDTAVLGKVTAVATDPTNNQTQVMLGSVGVDLSNIIEMQGSGSGSGSTSAITSALQNAQNASSSSNSNTNTGTSG